MTHVNNTFKMIDVIVGVTTPRQAKIHFLTPTQSLKLCLIPKMMITPVLVIDKWMSPFWARKTSPETLRVLNLQHKPYSNTKTGWENLVWSTGHMSTVE